MDKKNTRLEVYKLIEIGKTSKEIAEELKIKKTTKQLTTKEASKLIYILEKIEKWKKGQ